MAPGPPSSTAYGTLTVKCVRAHSLKTTGFMGKADPYAVLIIGDQQHQTKVHANGGKKPVWGDTFTFKITNEKEIEVRVMDKEAKGNDKPVGSTRVSIMDWIARGSYDGEVEIVDANQKSAGHVVLGVKFERPNAASVPGPPKVPAAPKQRPPGPPGPPGAPTMPTMARSLGIPMGDLRIGRLKRPSKHLISIITRLLALQRFDIFLSILARLSQTKKWMR